MTSTPNSPDGTPTPSDKLAADIPSGPADPPAPVTDSPAAPPSAPYPTGTEDTTTLPAPAQPAAQPAAQPLDVRGGNMGSAWIAFVIGALLLIVLLIFVLQNLEPVDITFFAAHFSMPTGVVILFAAIIGALFMAVLAAMRIVQLRHRAHKAAKAMRGA